MKRHIGRTACFSALVLGLAAVASAQEHRCTNPGLTGAWAYTETGTVVVPAANQSALAVAVGRYDFDAQGAFTGTQYSSVAGTVVADKKVGTYTLNADCTGTLTVQVFDPTGTTLRRTSVWAIVLADNATEMRGIMLSTVLRVGEANVPTLPIMTFSAKRLVVRDRSDEQ